MATLTMSSSMWIFTILFMLIQERNCQTLTSTGQTATSIDLRMEIPAGSTITSVSFIIYDSSNTQLNTDAGNTVTANEVYTHTFTGLTASTQYNAKFTYDDGAAKEATVDPIYTAPMDITAGTPTALSTTTVEISVTVASEIDKITDGSTEIAVTRDGSTNNYKGTWTGLSASSTTTLTLYGKMNGIQSANSYDVANVATKPSQPTLTITTQTPDSISIGITQKSSTTSYKGCIKKKGAECTTSAITSSPTFSGLDACNEYTVEVIAVYEGRESDPLTQSLHTASVNPDFTSSQTKNSITITFADTTCTGTKSFKACADKSSNNADCSSLATVTSPHIFQNLDPNEQYTIKLQEINEGVESTITSKNEYTAPDDISGVSQSQQTTTSVLLTVTVPTGLIDAVTDGTKTVSCQRVDSTTQYTCVWDGLSPSSDVSILLFGVKNSIKSVNAFEVKNVYTKPTPPSISVTGQTKDSITITVSPGSTSEGYKGCAHISSGPCTFEDITVQKTYSSLNSVTQYTVEVKAVYKTLESDVAKKDIYTAPDDISAITSTPVDTTSAELTVTITSGTIDSVSDGTTTIEMTRQGETLSYKGIWTGLQPGSVTTFSVKPVKNNVMSPTSFNAANVKTKPSAITNISYLKSESKPITAVFTFEAVGTVQKVRTSESTPRDFAASKTNDIYKFTIDGLTVGTPYTLTFTSVSNDIVSASSATFAFTTQVCVGSNCESKTNKPDDPATYACTAGFRLVDTNTGDCVATCVVGTNCQDSGTPANNCKESSSSCVCKSPNYQPDKNGNCQESCNPSNQQCDCSDKFDITTCKCLAGYVFVPASGTCTNNCNQGGSNCFKPGGTTACVEGDTDCICGVGYHINSNRECKESCDANQTGCACTDIFNATTCSCKAGYAFKSDTGTCTEICSPGKANCFKDNALCKSGDTTCTCGASYVITRDGASQSCTSIGTHCNPVKNQNDICTCTDQFNVNTCTCKKGYSQKSDDLNICIDIHCHKDESFCVCSDVADESTCFCQVGYARTLAGKCEKICDVSANCMTVVNNAPSTTPCTESDTNCLCKAGYHVALDQNQRLCKDFCIATNFTVPSKDSDYYARSSKCVCTEQTNWKSCTCLAGYVLSGGACTQHCNYLRSNCVTRASVAKSTTVACTSSDNDCVCKRGFYAKMNSANEIVCTELPLDVCDPSVDATTCSCTNKHDISTCGCADGTLLTSSKVCEVSPSVRAECTFPGTYDPEYADKSSQKFKDKCAENTAKVKTQVEKSMTSLQKVNCIQIKPGSIIMLWEFVFEKVGSQSVNKQAEEAESTLLTTLSEAAPDIGILEVVVYNSDGTDITKVKDDDDSVSWDDVYKIAMVILLVLIVVLMTVFIVEYCLRHSNSPRRYTPRPSSSVYHTNPAMDFSMDETSDLKPSKYNTPQYKKTDERYL